MQRTWQLLLHLNNEHADKATPAAAYAEHIQNNFHPLGEACLCGHWLNKGTPHTCVVALQLGMMRNKCKEESIPAQYIMIPAMIDHWLLHGHHEKVLNHPEYEYIFRYCSLCLNRHETPALLWEHFETYHSDMLPNAIVHPPGLGTHSRRSTKLSYLYEPCSCAKPSSRRCWLA